MGQKNQLWTEFMKHFDMSLHCPIKVVSNKIFSLVLISAYSKF